MKNIKTAYSREVLVAVPPGNNLVPLTDSEWHTFLLKNASIARSHGLICIVNRAGSSFSALNDFAITVLRLAEAAHGITGDKQP